MRFRTCVPRAQAFRPAPYPPTYRGEAVFLIHASGNLYPQIYHYFVNPLELQHALKTLEESRVHVPSLTCATLQFCVNHQLSSSALNYTGDLKLVHKV